MYENRIMKPITIIKRGRKIRKGDSKYRGEFDMHV
jgi:hypothetical protein